MPPCTFHQREAQLFPAGEELLGAATGEGAYPEDVFLPFSYADCPPGIENIEDVGAFQAIVVGGEGEGSLQVITET